MEQNKRQVLGILGGLGPAASCYLYQMLIDHTPARKDQDHIDLVLSSRASTPDRTSFIINIYWHSSIINLICYNS